MRAAVVPSFDATLQQAHLLFSQFSTWTRRDDDRLLSAGRLSSISASRAAKLILRFSAMIFSSSQKASSSEMLVRWPCNVVECLRIIRSISPAGPVGNLNHVVPASLCLAVFFPVFRKLARAGRLFNPCRSCHRPFQAAPDRAPFRLFRLGLM